MSKNRSQKVAKRKERSRKKESYLNQREPILRKIRDAMAAAEYGHYVDAQRELQALSLRYPDNVDVLSALVLFHSMTGNGSGQQAVLSRLSALAPRDQGIAMAYANCCGRNGYPVHAFVELQRIVAIYPEFERPGPILRDLEPELHKTAEEYQLEQGDSIADMFSFEAARWKLEHFELADAQRLFEELLAKHPRFVAARNNLADCHFYAGDSAAAVRQLQINLEIEPLNVFTLAALVRHWYLQGQTELFRSTLSQFLTAVDATTRSDAIVKCVEILALVGEHSRLVDFWESSEDRAAVEAPPFHYAMFLHYSAWALCCNGDEETAKSLWIEALKVNPALAIAGENLAELRKPPAHRHGAFAFHSPDVLPRSYFEKLLAVTRGDYSIQALKNFAKKYPEIIGDFQILMLRGDSQSSDMAVALAVETDLPQLLETLKVFASGQHGTPNSRMKAAQNLRQKRLVPEVVQFWTGETWVTLRIIAQSVSREPSPSDLPPAVFEVYKRAHLRMDERDWLGAERLLLEGLKRVPNHRAMMNNLAVVYHNLGRASEAMVLIQAVHAMYPDYSFGRIAMAGLAMQEDRDEESWKLVRPLMDLEEIHLTEAQILYPLLIDMFLKADDQDSAECYLQLLENADPDHPRLEELREQVVR